MPADEHQEFSSALGDLFRDHFGHGHFNLAIDYYVDKPGGTRYHYFDEYHGSFKPSLTIVNRRDAADVSGPEFYRREYDAQ